MSADQGCIRFAILIEQQRRQPLPAADQRELADHLATCADCRAYQEEVYREDKIMSETTHQVVDRFNWDQARQAIQQRITFKERHYRGARWGIIFWIAAFLVWGVVQQRWEMIGLAGIFALSLLLLWGWSRWEIRGGQRLLLDSDALADAQEQSRRFTEHLRLSRVSQGLLRWSSAIIFLILGPATLIAGFNTSAVNWYAGQFPFNIFGAEVTRWILIGSGAILCLLAPAIYIVLLSPRARRRQQLFDEGKIDLDTYNASVWRHPKS
ncbi:MAG: hypothetical protein HJJLKODD_02950 [Phycisphaerae bacterium]|nr:hypothetical protein [Phycisphaerae bacterium]